jgi:hypothetical protein
MIALDTRPPPAISMCSKSRVDGLRIWLEPSGTRVSMSTIRTFLPRGCVQMVWLAKKDLPLESMYSGLVGGCFIEEKTAERAARRSGFEELYGLLDLHLI